MTWCWWDNVHLGLIVSLFLVGLAGIDYCVVVWMAKMPCQDILGILSWALMLNSLCLFFFIHHLQFSWSLTFFFFKALPFISYSFVMLVATQGDIHWGIQWIIAKAYSHNGALNWHLDNKVRFTVQTLSFPFSTFSTQCPTIKTQSL